MSTTNQPTAMCGPNRRRFLSYLGAAPTLTAFAGAGLLSSRIAFADTGPLDARERRHRAFVIRRDAAIYQRDLPPTPSISNGDEDAYANRIASYTKGLPHNDLGKVDLNAYNVYLQALNSGKWADFEAIPLGGGQAVESASGLLLRPGGCGCGGSRFTGGAGVQQCTRGGGDGGGLLAGPDPGRSLLRSAHLAGSLEFEPGRLGPQL